MPRPSRGAALPPRITSHAPPRGVRAAACWLRALSGGAPDTSKVLHTFLGR